jgi:NADPH:quinone reductase-like Zn-dependent oxidoreductase
MAKVSAILIHEHGDPATVARLESLDLSPPGVGEARVRTLFSPINPADLNVLEGKYPIRPELPGVPGVEGVGVVENFGAEVTGLAPGQRVLLPHGYGCWREAGNVAARDLIPVPDDVPSEQAAMLKINPATALLMLREFVRLQPGDWVAQNAANSAVGRCVIQLAKHFGWRTLNIVRREELADELKAVGADAVLVDAEKLDLAGAANGAPIKLGLNAVGGDSAIRVANALADQAVLVTYGAMARQPLRVPNGLLIFRDQAWRGFWVSRWYKNAAPEVRAALFRELFALTARGVLTTPIEATYPLEQIGAALAHASQAKRQGKILLRCS